LRDDAQARASLCSEAHLVAADEAGTGVGVEDVVRICDGRRARRGRHDELAELIVGHALIEHPHDLPRVGDSDRDDGEEHFAEVALPADAAFDGGDDDELLESRLVLDDGLQRRVVDLDGGGEEFYDLLRVVRDAGNGGTKALADCEALGDRLLNENGDRGELALGAARLDVKAAEGGSVALGERVGGVLLRPGGVPVREVLARTPVGVADGLEKLNELLEQHFCRKGVLKCESRDLKVVGGLALMTEIQYHIVYEINPFLS
jgi:hypothetical protein